MNRRAAIAGALGATFAGAAGGRARLPAVGRHLGLPAALADLYDERFVGALPQTSLEAIATRLAVRGVFLGATSDDGDEGQPSPLRPSPFATERHGWRIDIDRVRANAATDELIEFDRSLYTETELLLYAYVVRAASGRHPSPA